MLKFVVISLLVYVVAGQQSSNAIGAIFGEKNNGNSTIKGLQCSGLEGTADQCLSCYTCDHDKIKNLKPYNQQYKLQLRDSSCKTTNVCCIITTSLGVRNSHKCGEHNPEGNPRRRRPSLRSVLEREYPWRAWIYSTNDNQTPLCSATYIGRHLFSLLTTATCIQGRRTKDLLVKFTKGASTPSEVKNIVVHPEFNAATRQNNIAIVMLKVSPGPLVKSVCVPSEPARYGTPCVAVSESELYINAVIPQQKNCNETNAPSNICTFAPEVELKPKEGEGLLCLENWSSSTKPQYMLYGISLNKHKPGQSDHISVPQYTTWIQQKAGN